MNPRIGIIQFPGVNCEYETARALESVGMSASILRWNVAPAMIPDFDGFVLPGGFSYEDRVRAGAVAASDDVMETLMAAAAEGKPILGICNGAQVLVESGLVPGLTGGRIDLALAPNKGMGRDGYYSNWVYVKVGPDPGRSFAAYGLKEGDVLPVPIAHSQGRFTSVESGLFDTLEAESQIVLKYCKADGSAPGGFPDDPNGSERSAAAICNASGNVVAMMPHPERSTWLRQVPADIDSVWAARRNAGLASRAALESEGPGAGIFRSMRAYIERKP
jgi:phosphoribosylformylglycinamidine synthase